MWFERRYRYLIVIVVLFGVFFSQNSFAFPGLSKAADGRYYFQTKDGQKVSADVGPALNDSDRAMKMGPAGIYAPIEIYPFEGGIEGVYPVYGALRKQKSIRFQWRGADVKGEKPSFILFEHGSLEHQTFFIKSDSKEIVIPTAQLKVQPSNIYLWYLGRVENNQPIGQSRVFRFQFLSDQEEEDLASDLKVVEAADAPNQDVRNFLKSQVFYKYELYHDMVSLLIPLYEKYPNESVAKLLYLGYVKIGKREAAKTIQNRLTKEGPTLDIDKTASIIPSSHPLP